MKKEKLYTIEEAKDKWDEIVIKSAERLRKRLQAIKRKNNINETTNV